MVGMKHLQNARKRGSLAHKEAVGFCRPGKQCVQIDAGRCSAPAPCRGEVVAELISQARGCHG